MHTKTNYPGCPRCGQTVLRALTGVGAMGGLVMSLAVAAGAAPAVSVTERAAARPAVAVKRAPIAVTAARQTAKPPRLIAEVRPAASNILQTAQRRLTKVASRETPPAAPAVAKQTPGAATAAAIKPAAKL